MNARFLLPLTAAGLVAAGTGACGPRPGPASTVPTPTPLPVASPVALVHATIWTGAGEPIVDGTLVLSWGRIAAVGRDVPIPPNVERLDLGGRIVTPGLIDAHSHNGVYPSPGGDAVSDGNEMTDPVTPHVWAQHAIWPQDPNFYRVLQAGNTASLVIPGSGNLIGGRGVVVHNRPALSAREMKVAGAPASLKMACGENPKRVYGSEKKSFPMTRMGNVAGYREAFLRAKEYRKKREGKPDDEEGRDLKMETLSGVLAGEILVQNHCYRADEMLQMLDLADEFGFKIRTFHHALEAYKIRDVLAKREVAVATWADWWGFKLEAYDGIPQNAALVHEAGGRAVIHSDSPMGAQMLNQEAAKALAYGRRAGIAATEQDALKWVTANPAWAIGVEKDLGTLEKGKVADLVVWSTNPMSVYARADLVFVEGALLWDRSDPKRQPRSDFEAGVTR